MALVAVLVGIPLLYVASYPLVTRVALPTTFNPGPHRNRALPEWFLAYELPYAWLLTTPARKPLEAYQMWVWRRCQ